jgi:proteasome lid subunit RPN8/RPN11
MMRLWLTESHIQTITEHALAEAPREACGVIGGVGERAIQIEPIPNVADDPEHLYQLDTSTLEQIVRLFRANGLSLIGIYHSHPRGDAIPSPTDVAHAPPLRVVHLLVGLRYPEPRLAVWFIEPGQVKRVELHVGENPPDRRPDAPLTRAQKAAIITSAVIAVLLVLIISLSLLPPAPVIVTATPALP